MLFIKNYLTKEHGIQFRVCGKEVEGKTIISLNSINENGEEDSLSILHSSVPDIFQSIKKSLNYIGKRTDSVVSEDGYVSTQLLDNTATEVAFYVKTLKTIIVPSKDENTVFDLPIEIKSIEEDQLKKENTTKHYPRDMIAIIVPTSKGENAYELICDERNLAEPACVCVSPAGYAVIIMLVRYPIWGNLKFPAYTCVKVDGEEIGAFKLGSRIENKISKNKIENVDFSEAKEFLDETFRIKAEKEATKNKHNRPHNDRNDQNGNGNYERKSNYNKNKKYGDGTFSPKKPYVKRDNNNNGGYMKGGKNTNFKNNGGNNNNRRNFQRTGQR